MTESNSPGGDERIGSILAGKYKVEKLLGKGGMGAVYLVTHVGIERRFALKLLHPETLGKTEAAARFEREAQAAGRIGHPNIIDVFDLGHDQDGAPYMVMELLDGESLAERVARGPLAILEAIGIMIEVLRALEAAHAAGIIHRDIKPANIFLVEKTDGARSVKVLDFGIAKFSSSDEAITRTGAVIGSPLYMAPEQVTAERDIDARVDVWAAGATLYELLAGVPAHRAPSHAALIVRIVTMPVASVCLRRPEVDARLDALVLRALAIDPGARFASAAVMLRELEKCQMSAAPSIAASVPPRVGTRRKLGLAALAIVAGAALVFSLVGRPVNSVRSMETPRADVAVRASDLLLQDPPEGASVARPRSSIAAGAVPVPVPVPVASSLPLAKGPAPSMAPARPTPSMPVPRALQDGAAPSEPAPGCASGQHETGGHCCQVGLVWQNGVCARPLGTDLPF